MRHYEVTFIVDPVLSGDEVKSTAKHIQDELVNLGCTIIAVDEIGLRQLAYPMNRRSSGVYFCVEFACTAADFMNKFELNLTRNEKILRYLTVKLDKYGIKFNNDKRNGLIGKKKPVIVETKEEAAPVPAVVDLDEE